MDQEWVGVVVVMDCPAGCRGDRFLAAGFEDEKDAKSQNKKAT